MSVIAKLLISMNKYKPEKVAQYLKISERQERDLEGVIEYILN